jgi:hypothetical protein
VPEIEILLYCLLTHPEKNGSRHALSRSKTYESTKHVHSSFGSEDCLLASLRKIAMLLRSPVQYLGIPRQWYSIVDKHNYQEKS